MYSYEDRRKAVELYIQYGLRASATIRELGYPDIHSLHMWYKEYLENGDLHTTFERTPKFNSEQRRTALEKQDGYYKDWLREHLAYINQKYQEIRKKDKELNNVERNFFALLMKLLEREIHVSTGTLHDDEGNPVIRTYMRVFDKRSQRYLEDLDQIFDTVLMVDFSVMEDDGEKD